MDLELDFSNIELINRLPDYAINGFWYVTLQPENFNNKSLLHRDMNLFAKSITIPSMQLKFKDNIDGSFTLDEQSSLDEISIELYDDKLGTMQKYIYWWFNCIIDFNTKRVRKNFRKESKTVTLTYYSITHTKNGNTPIIVPINTILLGSCMPTNFTFPTASDDDGTPMTYNLSLRTSNFKTTII